MKESKMLYIVKRLSKKLDEKNNEAIGLTALYDEKMHEESLDGFIEAMRRKYLWLGYSMAMDYCCKLVSELAIDVKGLENEDISDE